MRTYKEMISEFASLDAVGKEKWINNLELEEMQIYRTGLNNGLHISTATDWLKYWISYMDEVISNRIGEIREEKLKELGI